MGTLEKSSRFVIGKIESSLELFECFEHVYLFGSVLALDDGYNDIDILLIYKKYSAEIEQQWKKIERELRKECGTTIDLTVLSLEEEKNVMFLKRLKSNFLKVK